MTALFSASNLERIKQDAARGLGASSGDTMRLLAEVERLNADNLSLRGSCKKLGTEHAGMVRTIKKFEAQRLAGFWRSPKDLPPTGAPLIVLRDAGAVGNDRHPGHRAGRWLELTTFSGQMSFISGLFTCDAVSTGSVIGWVGVEEFQGYADLHNDAQRYRFLRGADLETIQQGGVFAGQTPRNVVLNGDDLDKAIDDATSKGERA